MRSQILRFVNRFPLKMLIETIEPKIGKSLFVHETGSTRMMLVIRALLFAICQSIIAGIYYLQDSPSAWQDSAAWWPITVILTNLFCLGLLNWCLHHTGSNLLTLYTFDRQHVGRDLLTVVATFAIVIPLVVLPNMLVASLLFDDPQAPMRLMYQPLPHWAIWVSVILLPITVALSELPTYFGYVMPRLKTQTGHAWMAILLTAFWFAAQHATAPLLLDVRFMLWRLVPLLPFTLLVAILLNWRPRLLPYFMVGHIVVDFQTALMLFSFA